MEQSRTVGPWASHWHAQTGRLREVEALLEGERGAEIALWLERASLYEALGLSADAKRAYLDVLARDESQYDAMMRLGELLAKAGDASAARDLLRRSGLAPPGPCVAARAARHRYARRR